MNAVPAKTRSDAWGEDLPEETRWELYNLSKPPQDGEDRPYLRTYELAREHIAALSLTPPARAGWYRFLARMRTEDQRRLVFRCAGSRDSAQSLADESRVSDAVAAEAFKALAVDAAISGDRKGAALFTPAADKYRASVSKAAELDLRARAQQTKEDELRLAREKFEAAEKRLAKTAETVADTKLTPEEKEARLKEIYGI